MSATRNFAKIPSKLLLFGEYTTLQGSMALAVPFWLFTGQFTLGENQSSTKSNEQIQALLQYLKKSPVNEKLDLLRLQSDLMAGLNFQSNIPQGYGLGSSGALVAAIWEAYTYETTENLVELKNNLGTMEAYFHGSSSGVDPLVSLRKQGLLYTTEGVHPLGQVDFPDDVRVFLTDTHIPRKTNRLVQKFITDCKVEKYKRYIKNEIIPITNLCIEALTQKAYGRFWGHLHTLSELQLKYFPGAIPESMKERWKEGLKSGKILFKLCGAGGGGYVLGFSQNDPSEHIAIVPIHK